MSRPTDLALLLALTTYPPLSSDDGAFGWACADEVAHQLRAFGFDGLRAQHVSSSLRRLATAGDEPLLRYVERSPRPWDVVGFYRITPAGAAHIAERMLWARGSRGKGRNRHEIARIG